LDYCQIIIALCDVLKLVYSKFDDEKCSNKQLFETIIKIDSKIKSNFYGVLEKEAHKLAKKMVKDQANDVNSIFEAWSSVN